MAAILPALGCAGHRAASIAFTDTDRNLLSGRSAVQTKFLSVTNFDERTDEVRVVVGKAHEFKATRVGRGDPREGQVFSAFRKIGDGADVADSGRGVESHVLIGRLAQIDGEGGSGGE